MLSLVEEILLLTVSEAGTFRKTPEYGLELAIGGAVLMDLALRDRVDADFEELTVVDDTPTGDPVLDPVLRELAHSPEPWTLRQWLLQLARVPFLRERALQHLVERGVLEQREQKFLGVFRSRKYPTLDGSERSEARERLLAVLQSDAIPDPRDVVLICLVQACALFPSILDRDQLAPLSPRIEAVARLDLIGGQMLEVLTGLIASLNSLGWWGLSDSVDLDSRIRAAQS